MAYNLARQSDSTLAHLQYLFKAVHGRDVSLSYFRKKYDTVWTGKKYLGYIAYDETGQPVASYAVLPCFLRFRNERILVAQAVDATTHPDHRNKGLFVSLATKTHQLAKEEGVRYVFSFPNANSYHGFTVRLHFLHPENAVMYSIPVKTFPLFKAANKFKWFTGMYRLYFHAVLKIFFKEGKFILPNSAIDENTPGIEHDREYFHHKSFENSYRIGIGKFRLWFRLEDGILAGDISGLEEKNFKDFIKEVERLCFVLGCHQFRISASPGTSIDRLFKLRFSGEKGFPITYLDLGLSDTVQPDQVKFVLGDSDTF